MPTTQVLVQLEVPELEFELDERDDHAASMCPAALSMFGYGKREFLGHNIDITVPEPFATGHLAHMMNFLKTGQLVRPIIIHILCFLAPLSGLSLSTLAVAIQDHC